MRDRRGANLRPHRGGRLSRPRRWGRGLSREVALLSAAFGPIGRSQPDASAPPTSADAAAITRALVAESLAAAPDRPQPAIGPATLMDEPAAASADRALAIDPQAADAAWSPIAAPPRPTSPPQARRFPRPISSPPTATRSTTGPSPISCSRRRSADAHSSNRTTSAPNARSFWSMFS